MAIRKSVIILATVFAFFVLLPSVCADSILISQTGPGTSSWTTGADETNAIAWSSADTLINGTISLRLLGTTGGTSYTVYLTTQLGPTMTAADILLTTNFVVTSSTDGLQWVDVLSDLSLPPGTYYVALTGTNGGWGNTGNQPTLTTSPGFTYQGSYFSTTRLPNEPFPSLQSQFLPFGDLERGLWPLQFSISGDVAPIPEPSTFLLLGSGIAGIIAVKRWRRHK